jgi:ferredoxin-nitrite reductase
MNKFERIKDEKDGLDVWPALEKAATDGWETLDDGDIMRLKWYGLYAHNTDDGYFMLRVKVIQGILTNEQVRVLADITTEFGRGIIDCTTRQCVQIHWLRLEDILGVFDRLDAVGLTTSGACGDITRNIVGSSLAGLDADEIVDGAATATAIHDYFLDNKLYSNLPRKYKVSIAASPRGAARGYINCLSLFGAIHEDGSRGYNIFVGGGLSSAPRFARDLDIFVTPEEVPEVVAAITTVFRDSEENRARRGKARLKFLVDSIGTDGYRAQVVELVGHELRGAAAEMPTPDQDDHVGITPQKDGTNAVGLVVPVGRLTGERLTELADLAAEFGNGELRLTHQQNVLIPHVPKENLDALLEQPLVKAFTPDAPLFSRAMQSCTGKEFCGLAKVHTKERAREIAQFLDERVEVNGHGSDIRIHFAGCSSSCAQHQIADIGIEGVLKKVDGEFIEAMDIRIGGRLTPEPTFGAVVIRKIPDWDLNETLVRILDLYEGEHAEGETFRDFATRTEPAWWTERLEIEDPDLDPAEAAQGA